MARSWAIEFEPAASLRWGEADDDKAIPASTTCETRCGGGNKKSTAADEKNVVRAALNPHGLQRKPPSAHSIAAVMPSLEIRRVPWVANATGTAACRRSELAPVAVA